MSFLTVTMMTLPLTLPMYNYLTYVTIRWQGSNHTYLHSPSWPVKKEMLEREWNEVVIKDRSDMQREASKAKAKAKARRREQIQREKNGLQPPNHENSTKGSKGDKDKKTVLKPSRVKNNNKKKKNRSWQL